MLVDDHPLVRIGIKAELKRNNDFELVGEAANGYSAINKIRLLKPDVILLDISLPDINGLEIIIVLLKKEPKVRIIALTMNNNINYVEEMMSLGASGYVLKDSPPEELEDAIYKVMDGEKYYCSGTKILQKKAVLKKTSEDSGEILTAREKQILIRIAKGETNKVIADKLFLSVRTVEAHRNNIKYKLNLQTAADLTRYALSKNWLEM